MGVLNTQQGQVNKTQVEQFRTGQTITQRAEGEGEKQERRKGRRLQGKTRRNSERKFEIKPNTRSALAFGVQNSLCAAAYS